MIVDINFVEVDAEEIINRLVTDFEQALGETFYPGDERRIFLYQMAQVLVGLYNSINNTGRQNLLKYARGEVLDAIGARIGTQRLQAQKATTTLRFTLSAVQPNTITIPAGTRATPDGTIYFVTKQILIIQAGATTGEVIAESTEAGVGFNGFTPGQINQIVDPVAFVASVTNIDTTAGGADTEIDDDGVNVWSGYRGRIREAPNKFSTAGSTGAYMYWAKTADANIQDVIVTSPTAGQAKVTILMQNGNLPTQDTLDAVWEVCSDKKVRPLTDQVLVAAPTQVPYDITLTYYISKEIAFQELNIRSAIEDTGGAVDQYKAWQIGKMGRSINPDYLRQLMLNAGAMRVDVTAPIYINIGDDEVASTGTVTITYGGLL